jgi:hypothetical protein
VIFHLPWEIIVTAIILMLLEVYRRFTGEKKVKPTASN